MSLPTRNSRDSMGLPAESAKPEKSSPVGRSRPVAKRRIREWRESGPHRQRSKPHPMPPVSSASRRFARSAGRWNSCPWWFPLLFTLSNLPCGAFEFSMPLITHHKPEDDGGTQLQRYLFVETARLQLEARLLFFWAQFLFLCFLFLMSFCRCLRGQPVSGEALCWRTKILSCAQSARGYHNSPLVYFFLNTGWRLCPFCVRFDPVVKKAARKHSN